MSWQPIETAPNYRPITVGGGTFSRGDDSFALSVDTAWWDTTAERWTIGESDGYELWANPTHWRELPEPPQ